MRPHTKRRLMYAAALVVACAGLYLATMKATPASNVVAAVLGYLASRLWDSWTDSRQRLHDRRRELYSQLLRPWVTYQYAMTRKDYALKKEALGYLTSPGWFQAKADLAFYASDTVLRAFLTWHRPLPDTPEAGVKGLVYYARLIRAIREDLGFGVTALSDADLLEPLTNFSDEDRRAFDRTAAST